MLFRSPGPTVDMGRLIAPSPITDDPMFRHERTGWLIDMAALLALAVAYGLAVLALLRRREPTVMRK